MSVNICDSFDGVHTTDVDALQVPIGEGKPVIAKLDRKYDSIAPDFREISSLGVSAPHEAVTLLSVTHASQKTQYLLTHYHLSTYNTSCAMLVIRLVSVSRASS